MGVGWGQELQHGARSRMGAEGTVCGPTSTLMDGTNIEPCVSRSEAAVCYGCNEKCLEDCKAVI